MTCVPIKDGSEGCRWRFSQSEDVRMTCRYTRRRRRVLCLPEMCSRCCSVRCSPPSHRDRSAAGTEEVHCCLSSPYRTLPPLFLIQECICLKESRCLAKSITSILLWEPPLVQPRRSRGDGRATRLSVGNGCHLQSAIY